MMTPGTVTASSSSLSVLYGCVYVKLLSSFVLECVNGAIINVNESHQLGVLSGGGVQSIVATGEFP